MEKMKVIYGQKILRFEKAEEAIKLQTLEQIGKHNIKYDIQEGLEDINDQDILLQIRQTVDEMIEGAKDSEKFEEKLIEKAAVIQKLNLTLVQAYGFSFTDLCRQMIEQYPIEEPNHEKAS